MKRLFCVLLAVSLHAITVDKVFAQLNFDVEGGIASTVYNDVRIPGTGGTFLSLSDELKSTSIFYSRIRAGYRLGAKHELLALYAPLKFMYNGSVDRDVVFQGETYFAGTDIAATYKFNSYRLTYRYHILNRQRVDIGIGVTLKVRDALIGLRGGGKESEKTDLGVVPLINFNIHWKVSPRLGLLIDGDALAAPQGRAEDVLTALTFKISDRYTAKAGYRFLEGGADNSTVYTFSMFHYGVLGVIVKLE